MLIPPHPGITSAAGLLTSDLRYDLMRTVFMLEGQVDTAAINSKLDELAAELTERLVRDGADPAEMRVERYLDCRYAGQGYELRIPVGDEGFARGRPRRRSTAYTRPSTAVPTAIRSRS